MPAGHVLEGLQLSALAFRSDCDEALYALNHGQAGLAIVHLTQRKSKETDSRFPRTWIFENSEVLTEYMQAAHAAWVGQERDPEGQQWLQEQRLRDSARRF